MGRCRLELGDRGAATGAWQAYLQVLTPSGPSGGTGNAPGTAGCSAGVPNLAKLGGGRRRPSEEAQVEPLPAGRACVEMLNWTGLSRLLNLIIR